MTTVSVEHALAGKLPVGGEVTVRGWVRTRRDSKAGLSFVNVSDGSCFNPIQVVAPAALPNYESEVKRLTAGCAVVCTGTLAPSQGQGQAFEIQAERQVVVNPIEDRPGAAAAVLRQVADAGVNIDLMYLAVDGRLVLGGDDVAGIRAALEVATAS